LGGGEQNIEKMMNKATTGKMPSMIHPVAGVDNTQEQISSSFFNGLLNNSNSFVFANDQVHVMNKEGIDEYIDDDDPGFDLYAVDERNFIESCKDLA
jgi:hypothetical protein